MTQSNHQAHDLPDLDPLDVLETALDTACSTLAAAHPMPDPDQEWVPGWRLPQTGHGWVAQWILSAACDLRQALMAYRHSYSQQRKLRLLPEISPDDSRPRKLP